MKTNLAQNTSRNLCLCLLLLAGTSSLKAANSTWTDSVGSTSTTGWNSAGNWNPAVVPWLSGSGGYTNALVFPAGITGAGLINGNDMTGATISGLTFNSGAGAYTLGGNSLTTIGGFTDNATSLETINFPIGFGTITHSINVISGGSLTVNSVISGSSVALTKTGGGLLTLTGEAAGANTYGPTTINGGTLLLDFTQGGNTPAANIVPDAALSLGGSTLSVTTALSTAATVQSFTGTTIASGESVISPNTTGAAIPTIALGAFTYDTGGSVMFNGPAYSTGATTSAGAGQAGAYGNATQTGIVGATAKITTTSGIANQMLFGGTTGVTDGSATGMNAGFATVGLYDYAIVVNTSPFTITGASQGTAQTGSGAGANGTDGAYTLVVNANLGGGSGSSGGPWDLVGTCGGHNTDEDTAIRFNASGAGGYSGGGTCSFGAVLETPNVGAFNITMAGANPGLRSGSAGGLVIWQNNLLGTMNFTGAIGDNTKTAGSAYTQAGAGTVSMTVANTYTGPTFLNNGVTEIVGDSGLGAAASGQTLTLNGGTVLGDATFTLDNAGANKRAVVLGNNGGGLAAVNSFTMTVDGVISGAGPLMVGITNASAIVPGTGSGTANAMPVYATGTVLLDSAGNTFTGGATITGGATLNINSVWQLGGSVYGGLTFNGGTLQYNATPLNTALDITANTANGSGLTGGVAQNVTLAGNATIDVNGNTVTYTNALGNGGGGSLTVASSLANGSLTLLAANTYTGNTTISSGTLKLASSASLLSTSFSVGSGGTFDVSALSPFTLAAGQSLLGGGVVTGAVTTVSSASIIPGTLLGGVGTLSFSNNLTLASGETNYFDLSGSPTGANDEIVVAGALTLPASGQSTIAINFTLAPGGPGTYKLFTYGTLAGGSVGVNLVTNAFTGFGIGSLAASLSSSTPGEIDLVLANPRVPTTNTWVGDGVANNWDLVTTNWINNVTGGLTNFFNFDSVVFNDNGSNSPAVNLTGVFSPTAVLVDTTNISYTFSGNGQLAAGTLTLAGSTTLTILTTNTLPGPIVIQGGTLQLGNGVTNGTIGLGNVTNNAALWVDSPATVPTGPIIGTGNVTVQANGTLMIGGNSTMSVLTLGSSDTSDTTGTLDLAGYSVTATNLTLGTDATGGTIGSSSISASATLYYTGTGSTYAGVIQDTLGSGNKTVALNLAAGSTLTLDKANTYSGGTIINNGSYLTLTGTGSLGSGLVTLNGGTLFQNADFVANTFSNAPATTSTLIYQNVNGNAYYPTVNLAGAGVLNLTINSPGNFTPVGNFGGFDGTINVSGAMRLFESNPINGGNAVWNFGATGGINCRNAAFTINLGALNGLAGSFLTGATTTTGNPDVFVVGALGVNSSFAGVIADGGDALTALTKVGSGLLVLTNTDTYTGPTIVSNGTLEVDGILGTTPTTNYSGATLAGVGTVCGVVDLEAGSTLAPGFAGAGNFGLLVCSNGLVLKPGSTNLLDISSSQSDLVAVTNGLNLNGGTVVLNISGPLARGSYPLISFDTLNGSVANLTLVPATQGANTLTLVNTGTSIDLLVAPTGNANLTWASLSEAQDNNWNVATSTDWTNSADQAVEVFDNGDTVTFNDTGAVNNPVNIQVAVAPGGIVVNSTQPYVFTNNSGAGYISGALTNGGFLKSNSGSLTIVANNSYTGGTLLNGSGVVQVGDGVTLDTAISAGSVTNNTLLIFNQPDNSAVVGNLTGTGALVKEGAGMLTLQGNSTFTGTNLIAGGTLQFGNGGATAIPTNQFVLANGANLAIDRSGTFAVTNGITGAGTVIFNGPGTSLFGGVHSYLNNTYISNGVVMLAGPNVIPNGGSTTGWLILDGGTSAAGTLDLNSNNVTVNALSGLTGAFLGLITNSAASGTNVLTINTLLGNNAGYAGLITDNTNSGRIAVVVAGPGTNTLSGANTYSGGTTIYDGCLVAGQAASLGTGMNYLIGGTLGAASGVQLNGHNLTVPAGTNGTINLPNNLMKLPALYGSGTLALNVNSTTAGSGSGQYGNAFGACANFSGTLNINGAVAGALMVMNFNNNSGGSFDGNLSAATVNLYSGVSLVSLNNSGGNTTQFGALNVDSTSSLGGGFVPGGGTQIYQIGALGTTSDLEGGITNGPSGATAVTKVGAGTLILNNANDTYTGNTSVSAGTLMLGASADITASPVTVAALGTLAGTGTLGGNVTNNGTIAPGSPAVTGTLTVSGNVTNSNASANLFKLDPSNSGNDVLAVGGALVYGGTLQVEFLSTPIAGTPFTLYNAGSETGIFGNIVGVGTAAGSTFSMDYSAGVLTVLTVGSGENPNPGMIMASFSGATLTLAWPTNAYWTLQAQTDSLSAGLRTNNWVTVPGSTSITNLNITVDPKQPTVFYRLMQ